MSQVREQLRDYRLLTITGSGGCGKTRLALEVGRVALDEFHDGIWFVDLAPLSDPALVWHVFATTLGIREEPGRSVSQVVADYLRDRCCLMILDNCEHLIDASARSVDLLLRSAANVRVLATSRELLGVPGEAAWRVRWLSVVDPEELPNNDGAVEIVLASEAARLLVDRAHAFVLEGFASWQRGAATCGERSGCLARPRSSGVDCLAVTTALASQARGMAGGAAAQSGGCRLRVSLGRRSCVLVRASNR